MQSLDFYYINVLYYGTGDWYTFLSRHFFSRNDCFGVFININFLEGKKADLMVRFYYHYLPSGIIGILIVAIMSAAMSSLTLPLTHYLSPWKILLKIR